MNFPSFPVGTILTRTEPQDDEMDRIRVIGGGHQLIVTSETEYNGPIETSVAELRQEYDVDGIEDPDTGLRPVDLGPSPLDVINGTEYTPPEPVVITEAEDPRSISEAKKVDTGVPVMEVAQPATPPENETALERSKRAGREGAAKRAAKKAAAKAEAKEAA